MNRIENVYGLILAGGCGSRLWPLSTEKYSKQFLKVFNGRSLLELAIKRIQAYVKKEHIFVIMTEEQKKSYSHEVLKFIDMSNILVEPERKNTLNCICYAMQIILQKYGDGIVMITPSDAFIEDELKFSMVSQNVLNYMENNDKIMLIGVDTIYNETDYGYIECNKLLEEGEIGAVKEFIEKPSAIEAQKYVEKGKYLWNVGIFFVGISFGLSEIKKYAPINYNLICRYIKYNDKRIYEKLVPVSIDYGLIEKSEYVEVIRGEFGWQDLGSWKRFEGFFLRDDSNYYVGDGLFKMNDNIIAFIYDKKEVFLLGLEDILIFSDDNRLLVCNKKYIKDLNFSH
ncbi:MULTISPECIES: sugar phosphate nucleotidyltransferase [Blautia]|uniref:sugar phosphate nucleotidyltransferase n=1 Tax=Blautia TaxID=572511 RepID=UPI000BA40C86|nr:MULTISPECIES: sugar phosphate nucleotidyltransferase [Blautia]